MFFISCDKKQRKNNTNKRECSSYEYWDPDIIGKALDANSHRSRDEIIQGVEQSKVSLGSLISKYPNTSGRVLVSIGINSCGFVDTCFIKESDIKNDQFINEVLRILYSLEFKSIDREDDYIVVDYPFVFSNDERKHNKQKLAPR